MKKYYPAKKDLYCAIFFIMLTFFSASTALALITGDAAPEFAVRDMQGIQRTLTDYQGQVVIINFWASYCPPCRQEKPSLEQLYQDKKDQGLQILAVTAEKERKITRYLKKYPLSFSVLHDVEGTMHRDYGVLSYPQTFVVDRSGAVVQIFFGAQEWTGSMVAEMIGPLLAE
jgi:peroxiredoxin